MVNKTQVDDGQKWFHANTNSKMMFSEQPSQPLSRGLIPGTARGAAW